jgi:hypothetical protein
MPPRRPQFPWNALLTTCRSLVAILVANMGVRGIGRDVDRKFDRYCDESSLSSSGLPSAFALTRSCRRLTV